jgi:hypothetical protein
MMFVQQIIGDNNNAACGEWGSIIGVFAEAPIVDSRAYDIDLELHALCNESVWGSRIEDWLRKRFQIVPPTSSARRRNPPPALRPLW